MHNAHLKWSFRIILASVAKGHKDMHDIVNRVRVMCANENRTEKSSISLTKLVFILHGGTGISQAAK
jgi:hypothetical protein